MFGIVLLIILLIILIVLLLKINRLGVFILCCGVFIFVSERYLLMCIVDVDKFDEN